jgi:hypothetical protein
MVARPRGRPPVIHTIFHAAFFVLEGCRKFAAPIVLRKGLAIEKKSDTVALLGVSSNSYRQPVSARCYCQGDGS